MKMTTASVPNSVWDTREGNLHTGKTLEGKTQEGKTQEGKTHEGKTQEGKILSSGMSSLEAWPVMQMPEGMDAMFDDGQVRHKA